MNPPIFKLLLDFFGVVSRNPLTGEVEANGEPVTGVASYTEAQIKDSGFDDSVQRFITVSDWSMDATGGSALLQVVPLKSGAYKFVQASPLYFATVAGALTALSSLSDWAGFQFKCGDVGGGNVLLENTGTRIRPLNGVATLFQRSYGSLASPSVTPDATLEAAGFFTLGETLALPAGLLGVDDRLDISMVTRKNGSTALCTPVVFFGTAGDATDSQLVGTNTITGDDTDIETRAFAIINSSTSVLTNIGNAITTSVGAATTLRDRSTKINIASTMYLSPGIGAMTAPDTVNLLYFDVTWRSA